MEPSAIRIVSHGGGRQTVAMLVLAAQGRIPHRTFLFANVGDHAENPDTLRYHREVAVPYAEEHGIELVEVRWVDRSGRVRDLYDDVMRSERSIPIPVRLNGGGFGNRQCTDRYKIAVVAREARKMGATVENPAEVAIGISTDEFGRAKPGVSKQQPWTFKTHPLLDLGLSKTDCIRTIIDAGLPVPPKSSCWFCPFHGPEQWRALRRDKPALWDRAVGLEVRINGTRDRIGRDRVGLASANMPLDQAIDDQLEFDGMDCDTGSCFT